MAKWKRVLLLIAIPLCMLQVAYLYLDWAFPPTRNSFASGFANQAFPRVMIYWGGGLISFLLAITIFRRKEVLCDGISIGGIYLMLLGANGGWWSIDYIETRLCAAIVTLLITLGLAWKASRLEQRA